MKSVNGKLLRGKKKKGGGGRNVGEKGRVRSHFGGGGKNLKKE